MTEAEITTGPITVLDIRITHHHGRHDMTTTTTRRRTVHAEPHEWGWFSDVEPGLMFDHPVDLMAPPLQDEDPIFAALVAEVGEPLAYHPEAAL